jgi:hypothetical protein
LKINIRNIHSKNILILIISLWCAIEFIISPYPYYGKLNGVFPAISIGLLTFDLSELFIFTFIGFSLSLLFYKLLYKQKVSLGYGYNKYLIIAFITVLLASIGVGFILRGPELMTMVRVQAILLLFIVFMNLYDIKSIIPTVISIIYFTGLVNIFIYIFSIAGLPFWTVTIYPDISTYLINNWFGFFISVFSFSILLNKVLISKKRSILDYILLFMILVILLLNIGFKPIFLSAFIVVFSTFLFFFKNGIKRTKIAFGSLLIILSPVFLYLSLDEDKKVLFLDIFSSRYLKAPAYDLSDVYENVVNIQSGGSRDFSAGRFDIWQLYFSEALDSPIVSDNYGYKVNIDSDSLTHEGMPAHNLIAHYTYYAGYIAGTSLVLIILYFIRTTFKYKNRIEYVGIAKKYNVKEYEFHGMLAFVYAIIVNEMIGGVLSNAKFSWFWWLIVVFILKIISEARMKKCINSQ